MTHPCIGSHCARRDGITCGDDCCDLEAGIYLPAPGELTPEQEAEVRAARDRREAAWRGQSYLDWALGGGTGGGYGAG